MDREDDVLDDAILLGQVDSPRNGGGVAADHDLARRVVVGRDTNIAFGRGGSKSGYDIEIETQDRCHSPRPNRCGLLHGMSAGPQQGSRLNQRNRPRRRQCRIFPKRMTGDILGVRREIQTALALEHPDHRHAHRHQRGLGIFGQDQIFLRAFKHERAEVLFQRLIDLFEGFAR